MENKRAWKLYENILEKIMWKISLLLDTLIQNAWYIHVYNLTEEERER